MYIIDTSEISLFPKQILLGGSEIQEIEPGTIPFIDNKILTEITNTRRRNEYITSRVLFAHLVDEWGWNLNDINLDKKEYGKPFIRTSTSTAYVSFTHSSTHVFCAIATDLDIGLDCERSDRVVNNAIVKRILSTQEWNVLGEDDPLTLWTIKEAAVKSLGTGLRTNLKEVALKKIETGRFDIRINNEKEMEGICFKYHEHHISLAW